MEKKYQLVAWTRNVADKENARLTMIPSLAYEMQEPYFEEIGRCMQEQKKQQGRISSSLAKRFSRAYESNARFCFYTGNIGDGLRYLCKAALYCMWADNHNDSELRHEFTRLCEEVVTLAKRYSREDILQEGSCKTMLELHSSAAIYHSSGNCCSSSEFNI